MSDTNDMKYTLTITVTSNADPDACVFQGGLGHWQDCFFSFPSGSLLSDQLAQIFDFCYDQKWNLKVDYKQA